MATKTHNNGAIHAAGELPRTGWYLWRPSGVSRWTIFYNKVAKRKMPSGSEWRGSFAEAIDANAAAPGPASTFATVGDESPTPSERTDGGNEPNNLL